MFIFLMPAIKTDFKYRHDMYKSNKLITVQNVASKLGELNKKGPID